MDENMKKWPQTETGSQTGAVTLYDLSKNLVRHETLLMYRSGVSMWFTRTFKNDLSKAPPITWRIYSLIRIIL